MPCVRRRRCNSALNAEIESSGRTGSTAIEECKGTSHASSLEIYESGTTVGGNGSPKGDEPRRVVSRDQVRRINSEDGCLVLFRSRRSQGVVYALPGSRGVLGIAGAG